MCVTTKRLCALALLLSPLAVGWLGVCLPGTGDNEVGETHNTQTVGTYFPIRW